MLFFLVLTGRLIHSAHRYSSFQLFKVPQRAAPPFTLTNSSLSQVSEHQPTQQSIEHHQTVFFWTYGALFLLSQKFAGSRGGGSEYCRVFNPSYLWGLYSIWYQICISQMGFWCFPVAGTHTSTRVLVNTCAQRLTSSTDDWDLRYLSLYRKKGCWVLIVATCRVSSTQKQPDLFFGVQIKIVHDGLYQNDPVSCQ